MPSHRAVVESANTADEAHLKLSVVRLEGPSDIALAAKRLKTNLRALTEAFEKCGKVLSRQEDASSEPETIEPQSPGTCSMLHASLSGLTDAFADEASSYLNSNPAEQPTT